MATYEVTPLDESKPPYSREKHEIVLGEREDAQVEAEIIHEEFEPKFAELHQLVSETPDATPEELAALETVRASIASARDEKLKPIEERISLKDAEHRQHLGKAQSEGISANERGDIVEAFTAMEGFEKDMHAEIARVDGVGGRVHSSVEEAMDAKQGIAALVKRARLTSGDGAHAGKLGAQFMAAYAQVRKWAGQTFRQDRFGQ